MRAGRQVYRNLLAALGLMLASEVARASDPDTLWRIVHDRCVPDQVATGNPKPCALVRLGQGRTDGYVLLKDLVGASQYLLLPTVRLAGIESPELLAPDSPNYFAEAWAARTYVDAALGRILPRDDLSLAVNSPFGRTQNQLHIHIDCIRPDIRDALRRQQGAIGVRWRPLDAPLLGHVYRARRIDGTALGSRNPFQLLAGDLASGGPEPEAAGQERMSRHSLVLVGADPAGPPGFILLDTSVDPVTGNRASGEELQDHACSVARDAAAQR